MLGQIRIQIAYIRDWDAPFRTAGRGEKGRAYLVGTCRRQRTRQGRRGESRRRSPNRRRQERETERGAAMEK